MKIVYFLLALSLFLIFSCETHIKPGDMCIHYGSERCTELDSGEEAALWCDGDQWRLKQHCGKNGICTYDPGGWRGAHCVY